MLMPAIDLRASWMLAQEPQLREALNEVINLYSATHSYGVILLHKSGTSKSLTVAREQQPRKGEIHHTLGIFYTILLCYPSL